MLGGQMGKKKSDLKTALAIRWLLRMAVLEDLVQTLSSSMNSENIKTMRLTQLLFTLQRLDLTLKLGLLRTLVTLHRLFSTALKIMLTKMLRMVK